jgi:hypothetical protein
LCGTGATCIAYENVWNCPVFLQSALHLSNFQYVQSKTMIA